MKRLLLTSILCQGACILSYGQSACTGINFLTADSTAFFSRTFEWAYSDTHPMIHTVVRGERCSSTTPDGKKALGWTVKHGYVGITNADTPYINEGVNEKGLNVGMFFFDHYAHYPPYEPSEASRTIDALDVSRYLLSTCATIDEVRRALKDIRIVGVFRAELGKDTPIHWRVGDSTGESIIIECTDAELHIYDNVTGVLTNSPEYPWHIANLSNYINITPLPVSSRHMGHLTLYPTGSGSGLLGLPGDFTPVSRFVRAFFFLSYSRTPRTEYDGMKLSFTILNNFDIPISGELPPEKAPDMPSATQWTTVINTTRPTLYYRTMYNSAIRQVILSDMDFSVGKSRYAPLDTHRKEDIITLHP